MKDLLHYIVSQIVTRPESISIEESLNDFNGRTYKVFNLKVDPEDMRLVIGKGGRTIQSLRNIIKIKAVKNNEFVDIKLLDTETS